jgi:hypothetical protein
MQHNYWPPDDTAGGCYPCLAPAMPSPSSDISNIDVISACSQPVAAPSL